MSAEDRQAPLLDRVINFIIKLWQLLMKSITGIIFAGMFTGAFVLVTVVLGIFGFIVGKFLGISNISFENGADIMSFGILISTVSLSFYVFYTQVGPRLSFLGKIRTIEGNYPYFLQYAAGSFLSMVASLSLLTVGMLIGLYFKVPQHENLPVFIHRIFDQQYHLSSQNIFGRLFGSDLGTLLSNGLPFLFMGMLCILFLGVFVKVGFKSKWVSVRRRGTSVSVDGGPWHRDIG